MKPQATLRSALKTMHHAYGQLHDLVSDLVESGKLRPYDEVTGEVLTREEYRDLVQLLIRCVAANYKANRALKETMRPQRKGEIV